MKNHELNLEMYDWRIRAALREDVDFLKHYQDLVNARAELMLYIHKTRRDPKFTGVVLAIAKDHSDRIAIGEEELL
jgi:ABC-type siderophore export system fused ATPase/permease subunit